MPATADYADNVADSLASFDLDTWSILRQCGHDCHEI